MRKLLWLCVLAGLAAASGCATVTRTAEENQAAWRQAAELDFRAIGDDWNLIWMADRQTRMTRWYTR